MDRRNKPMSIARKPVGTVTTVSEVPQSPVQPPWHTPKSSRRTLDLKFWQKLSRRSLIVFAISALILVALIIGLAAGLTHRSHGPQNLPLPSNNGGPYSGDLTYYMPGLGACGITSTNTELIVAVSHYIFDAVQVGGNPNTNPLCGMRLRISNNSTASVDLTVVDRCVGCQATDLDTTENVFSMMANPTLGRIVVDWSWLQQVPGSTGTTP